MSRISKENNMQSHRIGGGNFTFKGSRIDRLGATEYTLGTIAADATGSILGFENELRNMLIMSVESCKKSPRSDNMLIRVLLFSDMYPNGVKEIHGFKLLSEIDTSAYPLIQPGGMTPLNDACYSAIGASNAYAKQLSDNDFGVNGIAFIITDGGENASVTTMDMVKKELERSVSGEVLESMVSVLIGINAKNCKSLLEKFKNEAGISQFIDAGDATKGKLAKIAGFVSQSTSSQSQALGTGGPSQNISATI